MTYRVRPLGDTVWVNVSGKTDKRSYPLNMQQLSASPSIYATATQNVIHNTNDQVSAANNVNLEDRGIKIHKKMEIHAFEVAIWCMMCGRLNTAHYKSPLTAPTASASGHYSFGFQIRCILLAQKLDATRLMKILVLEVRREWLQAPLQTKHVEFATEINGALDQFLLDWIIQIEHGKDEKLEMIKQRALVRGIEEVKCCRTFFSLYLNANPNSRFSGLKFVEFP